MRYVISTLAVEADPGANQGFCYLPRGDLVLLPNFLIGQSIVPGQPIQG